MTTAELASLRRALLARWTEIYRAVDAELDAARVAAILDPDPEDIGDDSLRDELADLDAELGERERRLARQIEQALARMRAGQYGRCVDCDQEIPLARLRVLPWTERCAADQARAEGDGHHPTL